MKNLGLANVCIRSTIAKIGLAVGLTVILTTIAWVGLHSVTPVRAATIPPPASSQAQPLQAVAATSLLVATSPDYWPMEYISGTQLVGHDIDLMDAIGAEMGVTIAYTQVAWENLFPGLIAGDYDAAISSITRVPEREPHMDFTIAYVVMEPEFGDDIAIAVQEGNDPLRRQLNQALWQLRQNGTLQAIVDAIDGDMPEWQAEMPRWVPIGVAAALSGPAPEIGWPQGNSVQLAVDETNEAGGVDIAGLSYDAVLVQGDSACNATQAITAANDLLDAGVVAVVGHTCSGATIPAQPLYAAAGVPMITPSSTNPTITQQGYTTTFRAVSKDDAAAILLARHLRTHLGLSRAAMVQGSGYWPTYATDAFSDTFTGLGGTITSHRMPASTADYTATLTAIQAENPDAIYHVDWDASNAGLLSRVAHDLGMTSVIVAWDGQTDDDAVLAAYAAAAGAGVEGDYVGMSWRRTADMPGYQAMNASYQAAAFPNYGGEARSLGAFAYDAAKIIIDAIDRADSTDPGAIRDAISDTMNHKGVVGTYEGFDAQGDVIPQWAWLERYFGGQWVRALGVGLVTPDPTFDDDGFSWGSYQGLLRAESELGIVGSVYTSTDSAAWGPNLQQCADDGNELCLAVGFQMEAAVWSAAQANPNVRFALVDMTWENYPDNLRGLAFAHDEAGYLAGLLAGWMTESDIVGAVGGMEIPPVITFVEGYRNGARCANPDVSVLITYTGTFEDPDLGAQVAQEMITLGADVIFGAAGATGDGAVLTATQSGAWGVGVDTDQYLTLFDNGAVAGSNRLLSSAMKRVGNAVFDTIGDVVRGEFTSGSVLYDLAAAGVGLAPFHEADPFVPQVVPFWLAEVEQGIVEGRIDIYGACPELSVPIGVAEALSGVADFVGWPQANAVQLAISETNAAGGIDVGGISYTLALVTEDSACDATQAVTAATTLVDAGVLAVVGHTCSSASFAAQPVYGDAGVPMVSGSSTNPFLTEQGYTTTFRTVAREDATAVLLGTHFGNELHLSRAAIVEVTDSGVEPSCLAFSETFTSLGGTIVSRRKVSSSADYTATLTAVHGDNPEGIYYADRDAGNAGLFSLVAHNLGMAEVVIGWDSLSDDESMLDTYRAVAGPAAERDYAGLLQRRSQDMPGYDAFNAAYQAAGFPNYGGETPWFSAFAYDAAKIIIAAIDRADAFGPSAIRSEIAATTDYEGVAGTYQGFDANGDVIPQWAWLAELMCATPSAPGSPSPLDGATAVTLNADLDWAEFDDRWTWINENPANWSLSDRPGFLRIMTDDEGVGQENVLVQDAPTGNFTVTTRVMFTPTNNYQIAGLALFQDSQNYLMLGRAHCAITQPACVGNGIYFDYVEAGTRVGGNYAMTTTLQGEAFLRVVQDGGTYTGYYSDNGSTWTLVGSHTPTDTVQLSQLGVTAAQDLASIGIPADFDLFQVQDSSDVHTEHFAVATSYDVYFGPSADPPYHGSTASSQYPLPRLDEWTQYFWRVVAKNECGETLGAVWEFTTGANSAPALGAVDPSSGSGPTGVTTYFTTTWSDADGWEDLKQGYVHIGDSPSILDNVTLLYNAAKDRLWLRSDDGTAWTGGCSPGDASVLENSQAIVHCNLTTVQGSGDALGVTWAIEFKSGYTGDKKLGLKCKDVQKARAKAKWKGTWTIY
jgi:basic membrane protein A